MFLPSQDISPVARPTPRKSGRSSSGGGGDVDLASEPDVLDDLLESASKVVKGKARLPAEDLDLDQVLPIRPASVPGAEGGLNKFSTRLQPNSDRDVTINGQYQGSRRTRGSSEDRDLDGEDGDERFDKPMVTHIDVDESATCPVAEKDVDERTVASLEARGIVNFTPVQASAASLRWRRIHLGCFVPVSANKPWERERTAAGHAPDLVWLAHAQEDVA